MGIRIAVIDLLLAYPPGGGAGIDLFNNFSRLSNKYDIKVFGISFKKQSLNVPQDFQRGIIRGTPPMDYSLIGLEKNDGRNKIIEKIYARVSAWCPDLVFIADGWTLKPYLIKRYLGTFKTIVRLYAYEMLCPRNNQKWLFDHRCENNALDDCARCLDCTRKYAETVRKYRGGQDNPLTFEYALADIWHGDYHEVLSEVVANSHFIVNNTATKNFLLKHNALSVSTIPGAVALEEFVAQDEKIFSKNEFKILLCGRMDDTAKGAGTAIEACGILRNKGIPLKLTITSNKKYTAPWIQAKGWQSRKEVIKLLSEADCALVPSLWEESFGIAWVEAMAMKVPVIASRIGGPFEYIKDGVTGLLAEPGNPDDFAKKILCLYNDAGLRKKLSENGRHEVERKFTWNITSKMLSGVIEKVLATSETGERDGL